MSAVQIKALHLRRGMVICRGERTDRICDVRYVRDGLVHVDLNDYTATETFQDLDRVLVEDSQAARRVA